jgi:endo-1,4-beta-xylanase
MDTHRRPGTVRGLAAAAVALAVTALVGPPVSAAPDRVGVFDAGFEDGTVQGWAPRSEVESVAPSTAVAHSGEYSLVVTGRDESWQGPILDVLDTMEPGTNYTLSVWVRMAANAGGQQARLSVERRLGETANYDQVVGNTVVSESGWTQLKGYYSLGNEVDFLTVYVETAGGTADFYVDDFSMSYVPTLPPQLDLPSLAEAYAADWLTGAAVALPQIQGDRGALLTRHFSSITAENAMKWDATERTEGEFTFDDADALVGFAQDNDLQVYGHTLVWHNQTPAWVFQDADGVELTPSAASRQLVLDRLENHIREVVGHFRGQVYAWDVVNEVIDPGQTDGLRRSRWYELTGTDFLRTAFTVAHEVDPDAQLCINDYSTTDETKGQKLYDLVRQLRSDGVPVDCVGHQMHSNIDWPAGSSVDATLGMFEDLGVTQRITELDVSIYNSSADSYETVPTDAYTRQDARYRALFAAFLRHADSIDSVTFWGLADDHTWLSSFPVSRLEAPLLFDLQLQAKSAYNAVMMLKTGTPVLDGAVTGRTCTATYAQSSSWTGGFQAEVVVTAGTADVAGWVVRWTLPEGQVLTAKNLWGGTATVDGSTVTVQNPDSGTALRAGTSASVGLVGSGVAGGVPTVDCVAF